MLAWALPAEHPGSSPDKPGRQRASREGGQELLSPVLGCDPGHLSALSMYLRLILQQRPGARTLGLETKPVPSSA